MLPLKLSKIHVANLLITLKIIAGMCLTTSGIEPVDEKRQNESKSVRSDTRVYAEEHPLPEPNYTLTTSAAVNPESRGRHQSSLLGEAERENLREVYTTQTAILLSVACFGAVILLSINLVGVLFFKGYFERKAKPAPPPGFHLQSLSHSRRCRYSTLLRRFSLQTHSLPEPLSAGSGYDQSYDHGYDGRHGNQYISRINRNYDDRNVEHNNSDCFTPPETTTFLFMNETDQFDRDRDSREWKMSKKYKGSKKFGKKERNTVRWKCKHKRTRSLEDFHSLHNTSYPPCTPGVTVV